MVPRALAALVLFASSAVASNLVVTAKIVDAGVTQRGVPIFAIEAMVKNVSRTEVSCAMMRCSWDDSWRAEPAKYFCPYGWGCDGNYVVEYRFGPGETVTFRFQVMSLQPDIPQAITKLRVGFVVAPWPSKFWTSPGSDADALVEWSEYMELPHISTRVLPEFHAVQPSKRLELNR